MALAACSPRDGFFAAGPPTRSRRRSANPLAPKPAALRAPRRRASSSCSCTAGRATSTRSTTSRSCTSSTARRSRCKTFGRGGQRNEGRVVGPKWKFKQYGQCGKWVSDLFPNLATCVDDIAFLHSMTADSPIHGSAMLQMNTGKILSRQPVPGLVGQLRPGQREREPARLRRHARPDRRADQRRQELVERLHAGRATRATILRSAGDADPRPASGPAGMTEPTQRRLLDTLQRVQRRAPAPHAPTTANLAARIASYELAFAMQTHAPEAVDLRQETAETKALYGIDDAQTEDFGRRCLLARRLVERGVRFVQLYAGGAHNDDNWDAHGDLVQNHNYHAGRTDKPIAGLLKDLKRRGLLDETLVVWGGEFGRQPTAEYAKGTGRDHNAYGFTMWMAGGGVKGGVSVGETDELGGAAVDRPLPRQEPARHRPAPAWASTPTRLTYFYGGLDQKLVGVEGAEPIRKVMG